MLENLGIKLYSSSKNYAAFKNAGIAVEVLSESKKGEEFSEAVKAIKAGKIDLVISVPGITKFRNLEEGYAIRRTAADHAVPILTDIWLARRLTRAMNRYGVADISIRSWDEYTTPAEPVRKRA